MIKNELMRAVVEYSGQSREVVEKVLDTYMDVVRHELNTKEGGCVEVRGFGKFVRVLRKAKTGRVGLGKGRMGAALPIPAQWVVRFRPSERWDAPVSLTPTPQPERKKEYEQAYRIGDLLKGMKAQDEFNDTKF